MLIILLMAQTRVFKVRQYCGFSLDGALGRVCVYVCVAHCLFSLSISIGCLSKQTEKRMMTVITYTSKESAKKTTHIWNNQKFGWGMGVAAYSFRQHFQCNSSLQLSYDSPFFVAVGINWVKLLFIFKCTHNHVKLHPIPGIGLWVATSLHTPCSFGDIFIALNST